MVFWEIVTCDGSGTTALFYKASAKTDTTFLVISGTRNLRWTNAGDGGDGRSFPKTTEIQLIQIGANPQGHRLLSALLSTHRFDDLAPASVRPDTDGATYSLQQLPS